MEEQLYNDEIENGPKDFDQLERPSYFESSNRKADEPKEQFHRPKNYDIINPH